MRARVVLERRLTDGGADPDDAVRLDRVEAGAVEVDEQRRAHEAHVERGDEALASGDRLRVLAAVLQCTERLFEGARGDVLEGGGLHAGSPSCRSSQTRGGVSGSSTSSRPIAPATAFAIQTGALIVSPSPMPLAPSAVTGDFDETCPIRSPGMSGAVGAR